jgi:predicted small integral membrane protein
LSYFIHFISHSSQQTWKESIWVYKGDWRTWDLQPHLSPAAIIHQILLGLHSKSWEHAIIFLIWAKSVCVFICTLTTMECLFHIWRRMRHGEAFKGFLTWDRLQVQMLGKALKTSYLWMKRAQTDIDMDK